MPAILIGGTSHVGKSTVAQVVARRLGYDHVSTDRLGRHPGRPWGEMPAHVAEHYRSLPVDDLVDALLAHYGRMRSRVEELVTTHPRALVLEGSGVWPPYAAQLTTRAVWLTADEQFLTGRIHESCGYDALPADERLLVDKFVARSVGYQTRMRDELTRLNLPQLDVTTSPSANHLADLLA